MIDDSLLIQRVAEPLRNQVADRLRWAICAQRFPAGSRLVERKVCDLLGVSRTLVREALRQLEAEGFVVTRPCQGPSVASLDRETVRGIYEVRAVLEALADQLFVERATDAHKARLQTEFAALRAAHKQADPAVILQMTVGFYEAIFAGAQNATISATLRPLSGRIYLLRARSLSVRGRRTVSLAEMKAIHRALMGNDPQQAWQRCWEHVIEASVYALKTFDALPEPVAASEDGTF